MAFPMWVLGVILILIGSLGNNLGNNLVSLAHTQTKEGEKDPPASDDKDDKDECEEKDPDKRKDSEIEKGQFKEKDSGMEKGQLPEIEVPIVLIKKKERISMRTIGTLVFVIGNLFTFAAFGFGAQSLLASLESVQFVSNVIFAKYVHKEVITKRMLIATLSIIVGNLLVVLFSEHDAHLYDSRDIIYLYRNNTPYHAYLVIAGVFWFACHFTYTHYFKVRTKEGRLLWQHSFIEPFAFTISSAIVGTQAVLLSKCMSMLIQASAISYNEFERPTVYVVLVAWLFLVAFWLRRLDLGLSLYPPLFIIPVMQVFFVFFAILCGGIYFEEFNSFDTSQFIGFVFGVVMILAGVWGLAPTDSPLMTSVSKDKETLPLSISTPTRDGEKSERKNSIIEKPERRNSLTEKPERRNSLTGMERRGSFNVNGVERRNSFTGEGHVAASRRGSAGGMVPLTHHIETFLIGETLVKPIEYISETISPSKFIPFSLGEGSESHASGFEPSIAGNHLSKEDEKYKPDTSPDPYRVDQLSSIDESYATKVSEKPVSNADPLDQLVENKALSEKKKKRKLVKRIAVTTEPLGEVSDYKRTLSPQPSGLGSKPNLEYTL
jgi:hypothetical protein